MKKIIKLLMLGAGVLVALAVIAIAAFAFLFDPNALRDDITRLVETKTGRELTIEGDLSLSYFPWLGFEAGRTTLTNPEGFSAPVMASFEAASASVKLMPLFSQRLELSQITLDGVDLTLEVRQDGTSNWSDLQALQGHDTGDDPDARAAGFSPEGIGGIRLTNTRMSYTDLQTGDRYSIADLNLETGPLVPGTAFTLSARGDIASEGHEIAGSARLDGEVQIDRDGTIRITDPKMELTASGAGVPGDRLVMKLQAPALELNETTLTIDAPVLALDGTGSGDPWSTLQGQLSGESLSLVDFDRIDLPGLQFTAGIAAPELPGGRVNVKMSGERLQGSLDHENVAIDVVRAELLELSVFSKKVKASNIFEAMVIEAPIEVSKFSPMKLLGQLGYNDIVTADPKALSSSTVSGNARYSEESISIKNMNATVDQTAVTGSVTSLTSGEVRFQLAADEVDLDRYRAPSEEPQDGAGEAVGIADIEIPSEQLKLLALDGTLKVGKMQIVGMRTSNVNIGIKATGGDVRVKPMSANLYGGTVTGDIGLDASGSLPALTLNQQLDGVQFGPLSADLLEQQNLTGALSGRITVTGTGQTTNAIIASTDGNAVFSFADGAYEGTDIWYSVRRARALVKGEAAPEKPAVQRTEFGDLSGTAKIKDGVMSSNDINMVMPFMKARGSGSMVLLSQQIDFKFKGDVFDSPKLDAGDDELVGFPVPIKISGTASAPDVGVDMGGLVAELAKRKLLDKFGLGGKPAATAEGEEMEEEKDAVEELEDKVKDKLKGLFGGG